MKMAVVTSLTNWLSLSNGHNWSGRHSLAS